jgi:hypothetical protein
MAQHRVPAIRQLTPLKTLARLDTKDLLTLYEHYIGKLDHQGKQRLLKAALDHHGRQRPLKARQQRCDRNAGEVEVAA